MGVRQRGHSGFSLHHSIMQFLQVDHKMQISEHTKHQPSNMYQNTSHDHPNCIANI